MEEFFNFIGGTGAFIIFTTFGVLALRGSQVTYQSGHYLASVAGIILGAMWFFAGILSGYHVLIPWLLIGSAAFVIWYWQQAPNAFKNIVEGIFGWVLLLLIGGGIIIPIIQYVFQ